MLSLNQVQIIGYLGNEPEIRVMPNGDVVAKISVATTKSWQDGITNEKKERTEWHKCVFYRKQAEIIQQFLHKGSPVFIQGELVYRKWQDQNGVDRISAEIHGNLLKMLDKPEKQSANEKESVPQRDDPLIKL